MFIVKLLNKVPRTILLKFGYSKIGTKLVKKVREKQSQKAYDVGYGVKMYLDLTNPHTWDLVEGRDPEEKVKKAFVENIKEGDTVIDVGANIGEYALVASKQVGPKGRVLSIEPLKQAATWLEKNYALNDFSNYEIIQKAMGKKPETLTLYKKSESSEIGIVDPDITKKDLIPSGEILVDTIDNITSSRNINKVDLLKIDVEGFEYEVLCGCKDSFKQNKIKKIICEIHSSYLKSRGLDENLIYNLIKANGFSITVIEKSEDRPHILAALS